MPWWKSKKSKNQPPPPEPANEPEDWENEEELDEDDRRIMAILGGKDSPPYVTTKTLRKYLAYLREHVTLPCRVTGREPFPWEERYTFGPGNRREYQEMKKTNPCSEDRFDLLGFDDEVDEDEGITASVRRMSDQKEFAIGLDWLEPVDEKSPEYLLLDDYATWFVNYR